MHRAATLVVVVLGAPSLMWSAGAANAASLPHVYACTPTDTTAPTSSNRLTTVGTATCTARLAHQVTVNIVNNVAEPISTSSTSCASCATIVGHDSANIVPSAGATYEGEFVDTITAPAGSTFVPDEPNCSTYLVPNVLVCTAFSRFTY